MQIKTIESAGAKAKREKRNKVLIGIIISAIMIASSASFAFFSQEEDSSSKQKYNNITFNKNGGFWQANSKGITITTSYLPQETENITCEKCGPVNFNTFLNKEVYFSVDSLIPNSAINEIGRNLKSTAKRMQYSCLKEAENSSFCDEQDLPVKACPEDLYASYFVFEFRQSETNATKVLYSGSCITIEAKDSMEFAKAADAFIFAASGIKK
jgi:hypothetical protein